MFTLVFENICVVDLLAELCGGGELLRASLANIIAYGNSFFCNASLPFGGWLYKTSASKELKITYPLLSQAIYEVCIHPCEGESLSLISASLLPVIGFENTIVSMISSYEYSFFQAVLLKGLLIFQMF